MQCFLCLDELEGVAHAEPKEAFYMFPNFLAHCERTINHRRPSFATPLEGINRG